MTDTKIIITLGTDFRVKRILVKDPRHTVLLSEDDDKDLSGFILLSGFLSKRQYVRVSQLLRDSYDCCANHLDIDFVLE